MDNNSNMLQLCRLCLVKDDVNIPIFEEQGDIRQIFLKISSCLPVKLSRDDRLPKKICDGCSYKLDMLYEFWNTSANAEKQLLTWLGEAGMTSQMADGTISAVAQQIKPADDFVKQETIDPPDIASDDEDKDYVFPEKREDEKSKNNVDEPPPKRARRTAAVKAAIAMDQDSDDDDSGEPMTKIEDDSEDSDNDGHEPAFVDVPSTSADDQPGPSGVGKEGVDAPDVNLYEETNIACSVCYRYFSTATSLQHHYESLNEAYYCTRCETYVRRRSKYFPLCSCPEDARLCVFCNDILLTPKNPSLHKCFHKNGSGDEIHIKCLICEEIFTESELEQHLLDVKQNIFYYCSHCVVFFQDISVPDCSRKRVKSCAFCRGNVDEELSLTHICFHQNGYPDVEALSVPCDICNRLIDKDFESSHRLIHDQTTCTFCQVDIHNSAIARHMAKEHLVCHLCGLKFDDFNEYLPHNRLHRSEEKSNLCEICGKTYQSSKNLSDHIKKHTSVGAKPVSNCKECGKSFSRTSLRRHMLVHSDEQPFICPKCGKGFKNSFNLNVHLRSHDSVKPFECLVCQKTFTTKQWRDNHLKTHKAMLE